MVEEGPFVDKDNEQCYTVYKIAITSFLQRVFLNQCSEQIDDKLLEIQSTIHEAAQSIQSKNDEKF